MAKKKKDLKKAGKKDLKKTSGGGLTLLQQLYKSSSTYTGTSKYKG
jgi:hypothetical protein